MNSSSITKQIVVSATATRSSGTLTIYNQFLNHLPKHLEGKNYTIFVHPSMPQPKLDGVQYVAVHTEGQIQRIMFDWSGCKRELGRLSVRPDAVVSLQNTGVRCLRDYPQLVYYHLPFPFYDYKYDLTKKRELILELYKRIYPFFVTSSITPTTHMVAQIPLIAEGIKKKFRVTTSHVHTLFPDIDAIVSESVGKYELWSDELSHIVFPATAFRYKGHATIVEALSILKKRGIDNVKVHFTITEGDYPELAQLVSDKDVMEQVEFMGVVSHDTLLRMLKSSIGLLFPSVIETLGLPLIEAASLGLPVMVADVRYAHEVIGDYEGTRFISPYNFHEWAEAIQWMINNKPAYREYKKAEGSSWDEFFRLIDEISNEN